MTVQTFVVLANDVIRTGVESRVEYHSQNSTTKITHAYCSDHEPRSELEAIANFVTVRGFQTMLQESYSVPRTHVEFKTTHNDEVVRLTQSYDGFRSAEQIAFSDPTFSGHHHEALLPKDESILIAAANNSLMHR